MPNHDKKLLPNGKLPTHEDLRESVEAWTREIAGKCRAHGMPVAVFLVVVPLNDPKPAWAHNMITAGALELLSRIRTDVASHTIGLVSAMPHDLARKH